MNRKNVIPKYNVIKYINQLLYQLLQTGKSKHELTIEVIYYDFFISSFGLKSLAKKKLSQFINSIRYYTNVKKIKLFGRFVNLYKEILPFSIDDFYFYLTCVQQSDDTGLGGQAILTNLNLETYVEKEVILTSLKRIFKNKLKKEQIE